MAVRINLLFFSFLPLFTAEEFFKKWFGENDTSTFLLTVSKNCPSYNSKSIFDNSSVQYIVDWSLYAALINVDIKSLAVVMNDAFLLEIP